MKAALTLFALLLLAAAAHADDDHERAREALARGEILPLSQILSLIGAQDRSRLLEVELEEEDGRLGYDIEMITEDGRIVEIRVDAATGEILGDEAASRDGAD